MYGMGVAQNYEEAHSYFSKAAEAGNSEGRFNLGRSAPHAVLSCADCVAFRELCHTPFSSLSFAVFSSRDPNRLGALYIGGYGVKKDYGKALLYFASAAKQGKFTRFDSPVDAQPSLLSAAALQCVARRQQQLRGRADRTV